MNPRAGVLIGGVTQGTGAPPIDYTSFGWTPYHSFTALHSSRPSVTTLRLRPRLVPHCINGSSLSILSSLGPCDALSHHLMKTYQRPVRSKDVQGLTVGPLGSRSSRMTQFHRDQAYDGWEVVSPFMQDGTYRSRNSATLGPLTSPPPCALGRRREAGLWAGWWNGKWRHELLIDQRLPIGRSSGGSSSGCY